MPSVRLTSRRIQLSTAVILMVFLVSGCINKKQETDEEPQVNVLIDSTYHAMNPMDLEFDSLELVMIDSGMADLMVAYREIRAYTLPNTTPPALQFNPLPYGFRIP